MIVNERLIIKKDEIINTIKRLVENKQPGLVTYFNQHCFNVYYKNEKYKKLLDSDFFVYPDGVGVYFLLKYLFKKNPDRIDASSLNNQMVKYFANKKVSLFLIGGNFDISIINEAIKRGLNFKGYHKGYISESEKKLLIEEIHGNEIQIILIGMGVPLQELLAKELLNNFNNSLIICVGNFFEFYFGTIKRAPRFIQKIGLEWLFRLFTEPRRLWKRYLIGIPLFICRILKYKIKSLKP